MREAHVTAPEELLSKWEKRFYRSGEFLAKRFEFPAEPRLINRFCIGADPEFILAEQDKIGNVPVYQYAERQGLNTIDAFGCDMAGRQAELRAWPSRFVIEVVASLMDTLRWMNEAHSLTKLHWLAPAFFGADGCGGHVHVGRKRGILEDAVSSLDVLTDCLLKANILDGEGQTIRRRQTGYGRNGDYRAQSHGYEYRTLPTWMGSPWVAYLTLTLSKLAVLENLVGVPLRYPDRVIQNLLRAYQSRDDDAKIALIALEKRGFPVHDASDFKGRWGVPVHTGSLPDLKRVYFPPIIEPERESKRELFEYLVGGKDIPLRVPKPTWEPFKLPAGIHKPSYAAHQPGLPDIASGLLSHMPLEIGMGSANTILIQTTFDLDVSAVEKRVKNDPAIAHMQLLARTTRAGTAGEYLLFHVPNNVHNRADHSVNRDVLQALRSLLTESGLFPVAKYKDILTMKPVSGAVGKKKDAPLGRIVSRVVGTGGIR